MQIESEIQSGDAPRAVSHVAERCTIRTFEARRSPAQKLERVQRLQASGSTVAMIGDGINDAPVLGAANVSIAMGRGAALALAASDIVLVGEQLSALPRAIRIAKRTMRIARQNLIWAAAYNFCALPLAAIGLIPPWIAAIGMSLSSVAVVLNACRVGGRARSARATGDGRRATVRSAATSKASWVLGTGCWPEALQVQRLKTVPALPSAVQEVRMPRAHGRAGAAPAERGRDSFLATAYSLEPSVARESALRGSSPQPPVPSRARERAPGHRPTMSILFILIPLSLVLVVFAGWAFFWAVGNGQFDDLETPGWEILVEDRGDEGDGSDGSDVGQKSRAARP
jgi:cytochrome oxidase maturation protein, cbb3-type